MSIELALKIEPTPLQRFEARTMPVTESGCWLWVGNSVAGDQHGKVSIGGVQMYAHRAAWLFYRGAIPSGMCVLHKCDVPCCVNPDHLFLGTQTENVADMYRKGRHARQRAA